MTEPNKICKNPSCKKAYYGCNSCDEARTYLAWRTICCCSECFQEYVRLAEENNNKNEV
jgi:uncharacterized protein (DUF1810 family)